MPAALLPAMLPDVSPARSPAAHTMVGAFRLHEQLSAGATAVVHAATDTRTGREVVVKVLRPEYGRSARAIARFLAEARTAHFLRNVHVVEIGEVIEDHMTHTFCYAMERLEGLDLATLMQQVDILPLSLTLRLACQLAETLEAVHASGVAHRDLKPSAIFVARRGDRADYAMLLPFGVARVQAPEWRSGLWVSRPSDEPIYGVPLYIAPEQASDDPLEQPSDVYALGAILFHLVTGRPPFPAATVRELLVQLLNSEPPAPGLVHRLPHVVPPELDALVLACLDPEPARRPSMAQVAAGLRGIEQMYWTEREIIAEPPSSAELLACDAELVDTGWFEAANA